MPPNNQSQGQRSHVSIFDRRGQKPGRGRTPTAKGNGPYAPGSGHRHDDAGQTEPTLFNKTCMLRVHDDTFSTQDLVLNPAFFPGIRVGDIVAIKPDAVSDDGELASPRNSLDNDAQAVAAAAAAAGAHAGDSAANNKGKSNGTATLGSAANGNTAAETGEGGAEASGSNAGAERTDRSHRGSNGRRPEPQRRGSTQGNGHPFRNGRTHGQGALRKPSRWIGMAENDRASAAVVEDDDMSGLRPDTRREILLQVGEVRRDTQQIQASMSNNVARTLWDEYATNQRVAIRKIDTSNEQERESIRADFVEIAFRDQYVGRSDMWRLWRNLSNKVVHNNKPTNVDGLIRASVRRIYKNSAEISCGYIGSETQPIFRSESGRFIIFIQMSEEMWAYQEDGHLCFEKTVNSFLAELFRRWSEKQLNHMVTIVMFSRWYYHQRDSLFFPDLIYDEDHGRYYRDYYKVVADMEVRPDWTVFLPEILAEFNTYRRDIQELSTPAGVRLRGDLSKAHQGNILEAINLGINSFSSNYVDRDLSRTGLSTIVVTPSFGVFDVPKRLLRMTTERMLHFGMRVDFVCLAPRPLFRPPVFRFKSYPVPSEQEQRRALNRLAQAERDARRAKETEINSVSPLAESPGPHSGPAPFIGAIGLKDRGPKAMAASKPGHSIAIDPLMLDPLYFDDDKWVNELLPHLTGVSPRALFGSSANNTRQISGSAYSKQPGLGSSAADVRSEQSAASIIEALIGNRHDIDPSELPDTIKELHAEQYPFFAQHRSLTQADDRIVYYYFAYWVDSGFYNYTDQSAAHHTGDFSPTCKMGELSVTGVANYMRQRPMIPDLDLVKAVHASAGTDTDYAASITGYDTRTMGSNSDSPSNDALRARSEECRSIEAQMVAMARDVSHGRVLRSDRLTSAQGHERLLDMFAKFDHLAIVGNGAAGSGGSTGMGTATAGLTSGLGHTGSILENRYALGHLPTPMHLSQHSAALVPSNASAHWEEQSGYHIARAPESRTTERTDAGVSSSVEPAEVLPAVSSSASPNLRHSQPIKPPARSEHDSSMSSSVPRESKLSGNNNAGTVLPRTSVFMRSHPPAKRAVPQPKQSSEHMRPIDAPNVDRQRHSIAGPSSLFDMSIQAPSRARGSTPDANGARHSTHRVSGSPQSVENSRGSLGTIDRSGSGLLVAHGSNSDRLGVSESIARQSHLEDHIRTFRGSSGNHEIQHHIQSPPTVQSVSAAASAGTGPRQSTQESDFQLTLPAGRQLAVPFSTAAAPNQPSAPLAPDYHSGSPQYNKAAWLDRLSAHGPDSGTSRTLRGRSYDPYNPCNPELYPLPQTELSQRWTYAFSTHTLLSSYTPKWRSLCTPASLPLVTDYYPTDLDSFYHHYFYHIKTPDINAEDFVDLPQEDYDEFSQFMSTRTQSSAGLATRTDAMRRTDRLTFIMLKEMVYQRLAQGFQFIVMDQSIGPRSRDTSRMVFGSGWPKHSGRSDSEWFGGRSIADYASGSSTMAPPGTMQKTDRAIWLSNGRQIQKLEFHDNSSSTHMPGVLVTRWERNKPFDQSDLRYRFQMWSRNNNMGYSAADTRFSYPMDEEVNWNNLDYLITGYQSNLTRAMRYWRTRYVLIPMEQLGNDTIVNTKSSPHMSVEDLRIANFEKFLDHILRLLRKDEKNRLEDRFLGSLPSELRRSTHVFGSHESSRRNALKPNANGSQSGSSQQQFPAPPPQLTHALSMHDTRKAIGLSDLVPSSLMQVRYTTLYPVQYIANQLSSYMSDAIYLDPSTAIPLPAPAATVLGLADSINAESPFAQLAHTLQHPQAGLSLRNTRWHFGYFKNIFVGYQLVDWVLVNFDSVTRRSQAVAAGNRLMERGVFRSPHRPSTFLDGFYFYEFTEAALRCKSQSQATSKSQNSLMTSIGFADMVSRYGPGSNNPSPSASRPVSRQGSAAPSLVNDAEPVAGSTANTPNISTVLTGNTPKPAMLDGRDARKQGPRTSSLREAPNDLSVDPRMGGSSAQPLSRLRERSDVPVSSSPTAPGTMPFSMRVDESGGSSSTNSGRRGADADRQRVSGGQYVANSNGHSVNVDGQTESSPQSAAFEFERTPDIFPEQLRAHSRRPLPKSLHQSRVFALDLDQQRKSTRIEQCVVHLDAVHNPTTCFHLSVNWLNCTSHLVDELVRGWARMAERCGMRLVEAPRAQDTSAEDNHPFHSPIRITLAAPPPPATHIFDADWEDEFALFGDDVEEPGDDARLKDSGSAEPGSNGAEPNGLDSAEPRCDLAEQRRARVRMRMVQCIPTFPFERELLEEQDFVLDVEAEASYPPSSLMAREYTYDRAGHQYTQYVHRSGTAFVQICGPGQFLWLNNYLYTSHQSHVRPPPQSQATSTSLAAGASQMSLGTYNARNDGSSVTLAAGPSSEASSGSAPASRPLGRLVHSSSGGGRAAVSTGHDSDSYVAPNRAAPVYYPMRQSREMWPHQVLHSLARNRSPSRQLNVPDTYSAQIVDDLGKLPADFDSVNAAVTRVAVMRDAAKPSRRSGRSKHAVNETRGDWAGSASGLAGVPQADAGPDALRANFIEICTDENSLKMFWQQTIQRYRSGWRDIKAMQSVPGEPQRSRPMVVDKFSEAMWQQRRHMSPTA